MPNRILKESICTSETVDQMSQFQEIMFYRLLVNCDDYGRMDARPAILKARLFPLKQRITLKEIEDALRALAGIGCVRIYRIEGKPFLYFPSWEVHQTVRAKKSKYPAPEQGELQGLETADNQAKVDEIKCDQVKPNVPVIQSNPNPNPNPNAREDALVGLVCGEGLREKVREWLSYKQERREPYKATGLKSLVGTIQKKACEYGEQAVMDAITMSMAANYQGIVWDRLQKGRKEKNAGASSFDLEELEKSLMGVGP